MSDNIGLLIVDDEQLIRSLVRKCVRWEEIGIHPIWEAESAEEALKLAEELRPELVITDICMSSMDGVSLAEKLIQAYPPVKVIILTGYQEFEFAQRSIRAGVSEFLVKPLEPRELQRAALRLKAELLADRARACAQDELTARLEQDIPYARAGLLLEILLRQVEPEALPLRLSSFGFDPAQSGIQAAVLSLDRSAVEPEEAWRLRTSACMDRVRECLGGEEGLAFFSDVAGRIVLLGLCTDSRLAEHCLRLAGEIEGLYIGMGDVCGTFAEAHASYRQAVDALGSALLCGNPGAVTRYGEIRAEKRLVEGVKLYLREHLADEGLSLPAVAEEFHVSAGYLSRTFKQETEINFVKFLRKLRMERAAELLRSTDQTAYQVGEAVGVADSHYFSLCFKRYAGMSASKYRQQYRSKN